MTHQNQVTHPIDLLLGESGSLLIEMRTLAGLLGVQLDWRPWPRKTFSRRELRLIEQALAHGHYALDGVAPPPPMLAAKVTVRRATTGSRNRSVPAKRLALSAWSRFVASIGLVAALITIGLFVLRPSDAPQPLSGEMNVAVVPFRATSTNVSQRAADGLSRTLATTMTQQLGRLDPNVVFDVQPTPGPPLGGTLATAGSSAASLARRLNADVVIFGELSMADGTTTLTPYVYVAPGQLLQAWELVGAYPMGDPISLPLPLGDSAPAEGEVRLALAGRAYGLSEFVDAIDYYSDDRFNSALQHLMAAARAPGWTTATGRALLDLFLGNVTAKLAADSASGLLRARRYYRAALSAHPGFERAQLGLAEISFQLAHGDCTHADVDAVGLQQALTEYHAVGAALGISLPPQERLELTAKVRFGIGGVYLCQSQAGIADRWNSAAQELRFVTATFPRDPLLRDAAAEAWGDLAVVELPRRNERSPNAAFRAASTSYSRAIALELDPTALPALYANRAFIESRLGELARAAGDYKTASRLEPYSARSADWKHEALRLGR